MARYGGCRFQGVPRLLRPRTVGHPSLPQVLTPVMKQPREISRTLNRDGLASNLELVTRDKSDLLAGGGTPLTRPGGREISKGPSQNKPGNSRYFFGHLFIGRYYRDCHSATVGKPEGFTVEALSAPILESLAIGTWGIEIHSHRSELQILACYADGVLKPVLEFSPRGLAAIFPGSSTSVSCGRLVQNGPTPGEADGFHTWCSRLRRLAGRTSMSCSRRRVIARVYQRLGIWKETREFERGFDGLACCLTLRSGKQREVKECVAK
ncbi:hypothetical protein RRG08_059341 [Elysia crispata]|uniref:Uncharacterized protein n=1 Tax=Elysia crispata TaxID=231223 RepID=A0AAE1BFH8_9GAST|nr:hypothetical protein RRG08_059341 [Elysia crispata]